MNETQPPFPTKCHKTLRVYSVPLSVFVVLFLFAAIGRGESHRTVVINNVTVVDVENERFLKGQEIYIRGGRIERIGPQPNPPATADEVIEGSRLVALPGFVNTHTHLWQHVAKSVAPNGTLQQWVSPVYAAAHYLTRDQVQEVIRAAAGQALLSGITTVLDFASCNQSEFALDATIAGLKDVGIDAGVIWWVPLAFIPPRIQEREIARLNAMAPDRFQMWIGPSPLSFFDLPVIHHGIALARRTHSRLAEHTMENVQEQRDLAAKTTAYLAKYGQRLAPADRETLAKAVGKKSLPTRDNQLELRRQAEALLDAEAKFPLAENQPALTEEERKQLAALVEQEEPTPVPILEMFGGLQGFLAIHSVWPNDPDIAAFARSNVSVSLNPESNMYLASGAAPISAYVAAKVNISIGTDGAASNDGIDFFSAMRAAWNLEKVDTLDPRVTARVTAWQILRAATINGAKAMGRDDLTGSLRAGKEADIVLLTRDRLGLAPFRGEDSLDANLLVNSAGVRDISVVISNGKVLVRDGRFTHLDEAKLAQQLSDASIQVAQAQKSGKIWTEDLAVDANAPSLLRYRSLRMKDQVKLSVTNRLDHAVEVFVAKSGQRFGGACAAMLSEDVLARTPLEIIVNGSATDPGSFYKEWRIRLEPGKILRWEKVVRDGQLFYQATGDAIQFEDRAGKSEQLLLLVE